MRLKPVEGVSEVEMCRKHLTPLKKIQKSTKGVD